MYSREHRGEEEQQPAIFLGLDEVEVVAVGEGDERPVFFGQVAGCQGLLRQHHQRKQYLRGHRGEVEQQSAVLLGRHEMEVVVVGEGDERPVVLGQSTGG